MTTSVDRFYVEKECERQFPHRKTWHFMLFPDKYKEEEAKCKELSTRLLNESAKEKRERGGDYSDPEDAVVSTPMPLAPRVTKCVGNCAKVAAIVVAVAIAIFLLIGLIVAAVFIL
jgi:hypothetical protein